MKNVFGIHATAIIGENVSIGKNVTVGPNAVIYDNVVLGDNTIVGAHCILGEPNVGIYSDAAGYENPKLTIGSNSLIRSGTIIYAGSDLGERFECGHRVTIRENSRIGKNVRVGTLSDIQGHCEIGDFVRFHSNVHIGHKSVIKDFVWIFPYVVLTNDPHPPSETLMGVTVEEFAVIATMSVVLPGVTVGRDSLVGASSMVRKNVDPETVVAGNPAKVVASIHDVKSKADGSNVYPWRESFDRGMPWQGMGFDAWRERQAG
jgi:acetyltransferase-like isoleucine patch superfamily enzyme